MYPMYDFAHGYEDAIEGITHSICTLEFEDHRPLYDWLLDNVSVPSRPRQYEFARLNLTYTVMSKRLLLTLVNQGLVAGWDDKDAHHKRHQEAGLHSFGDSQILPGNWFIKGQQHGGRRVSSACHKRRAERRG